MKQIVTIGDQKVTIRGIKVKEAKEFTTTIPGKIEAAFALLDEEDLFAGIEKFAVENLEALTAVIVRFTDLDATAVDELELTELVQLLQELLKANGVTIEKVMDFFTKASALVKKADQTTAEVTFAEPVPVTP